MARDDQAVTGERVDGGGLRLAVRRAGGAGGAGGWIGASARVEARRTVKRVWQPLHRHWRGRWCWCRVSVLWPVHVRVCVCVYVSAFWAERCDVSWVGCGLALVAHRAPTAGDGGPAGLRDGETERRRE